jgi:phage terminase large subunit GpA-like protein
LPTIAGFVNITLGESYEEDAEKTDTVQLKQRAEDFPLQVVPKGGLILKAGVDVQKDRFEVVAWAFARGEEMWTVDYQLVGCAEYAKRIYRDRWASFVSPSYGLGYPR